MRMHVSQAKQMALLGVMAAVAVIFLLLGTVISVNTVFFMAAAAFLTGMAVVMFGGRLGFAFYVACGTLDFLLNPNKLHVILYLMMAGYTLLSEIIWKGMEKGTMPDDVTAIRRKEWLHQVIRLILFLILFVPLSLFLPELLVSAEILEILKHRWFFAIMTAFGLISWIIFDAAYAACKRFLWRFIKKIWKEKERE